MINYKKFIEKNYSFILIYGNYLYLCIKQIKNKLND